MASSGFCIEVGNMEKAKQKLQALKGLWEQKRGTRTMPSRDDLPVAALRPWLGNLALIDLIGATPSFRLCGTALHARFGGEMTKQRLDAIGAAYGHRELLDCIEIARQTRNPVPMVYEVSKGHSQTIFHELCLPLGRDEAQPDTMLFASYPELKR